MNEEQKDQQLDAAYRRASADAAGRPDAKTRAAILAGAAAAARRRTPAANDSRYLMRAVAGLAVIGVGLLLWRQTEHRLPGEPVRLEAPVAEYPIAQEAADAAADQAFVPDPDAPEAAPREMEKSESSAGNTARVRERSQPPPAPAPAQAPVPAPSPPAAAESSPLRADVIVEAPPAPPPAAIARTGNAEADENAQLEEVQVTGSRVVREPRRTVGPRDTVPAPAAASPGVAELSAFSAGPSGQELLQRHFAAQYQSDTPRRLWLVREANGAVVRTGELAPGEQFATLIPGLRQSLGSRQLTLVGVQTLVNARGAVLELGILQLR